MTLSRIAALLSGAYFVALLISVASFDFGAVPALVTYGALGIVGALGAISNLLNHMRLWRIASLLALGLVSVIFLSPSVQLVAPAPLTLRFSMYMTWRDASVLLGIDLVPAALFALTAWASRRAAANEYQSTPGSA